MRSSRFALIVSFLCTILAFTLFALTTSPKKFPQTGGAISKVRAFTATRTVAKFRTGSGVPFGVKNGIVAVRSDGSHAELEERRDPTGSDRVLYLKKITDVIKAQQVVVDPWSESRVTYPRSPEGTAYMAAKPQTTCAGEPEGKLLGYPVVLLEETKDLPAGPKVQTRSWLAPGLDCYPLRREMRFSRDGKEFQLTIEAVSSVVEGAPESWLFEVPANYVERSPSEVIAENAKRYPQQECAACSFGLQAKDQAYAAAWTAGPSTKVPK